MQKFVEKLEEELQIVPDDEKSIRARQDELIAALNRLTRDAEQRNGAVQPQQICPVCRGKKLKWIDDVPFVCPLCKNTGQI